MAAWWCFDSEKLREALLAYALKQRRDTSFGGLGVCQQIEDFLYSEEFAATGSVRDDDGRRDFI